MSVFTALLTEEKNILAENYSKSQKNNKYRLDDSGSHTLCKMNIYWFDDSSFQKIHLQIKKTNIGSN